MSVRSSDGSTFGSSVTYGTLTPGYDLSTAAVSGNAQSDVVGQNPLTGDILVARSTTAVPPGKPVPGITVDPAVPVEADAVDAASGSGTGTPPGTQDGKPRLAAQVQSPVLGRNTNELNVNDPFGSGDAQARARIQQIFNRLKQMGVTVLRFNVGWGTWENRVITRDASGNPTSYAGSTHYGWDEPNNRLDTAINLAHDAPNNFSIELTFTGNAKDGSCSGDNPHGFSCSGDGVQGQPDGYPTDASPAGTDAWVNHYAQFVRAGVDHFTTGPKGVRVNTFSFWNEPNHPRWLRVSANNFSTFPFELYHKLYQAAWAQYNQSVTTHGVTNTQTLFGELSDGGYSGRHTRHSVCYEPGGKKCYLTPADWLQYAVRPTGYTDTVVANGVALHPYQQTINPKYKSAKGDNGIGNLKPFKDAISQLCNMDANHRCQGALQPPDRKMPGLFLTEFGYENTPGKLKGYKGKKLIKINARWHLESTRRTWLRGTRIDGKQNRGALDQAALAGATWMLYYEAVENPPTPRPEEFGGDKSHPATSADTGLFGFLPANQSDTAQIVGSRPYGKQDENKPDYRVYLHPQKRRAYCAVREWAIWKGYFNPASDPSLKNPCPVPKSGRGGT